MLGTSRRLHILEGIIDFSLPCHFLPIGALENTRDAALARDSLTQKETDRMYAYIFTHMETQTKHSRSEPPVLTVNRQTSTAKLGNPR